MMITTLASTGNQTMKVKRRREGEFCVTLFFWVLFCGESFVFVFLSFTFLSSRKSSFYHQESNYYLQIKHNRKFLHKVNNFVMDLVFFSFCHNPNEIPKEKVEKEIEECVVGVNV